MSLTPSSFEQADYIDAPVAIEPDATLLPKAIAFGIVGAILGAIAYATFITATGIQIGYLAIGVAFLVAKGMMIATNNRGGQTYQITAIILTICSVALGNTMMLWWGIHKQGLSVPFSAHSVFVLLKFGFSEPFLEFQSSPGGAILGLFILFIGLRAAWRMTSGVPGAAQHPFRR